MLSGRISPLVALFGSLRTTPSQVKFRVVDGNGYRFSLPPRIGSLRAVGRVGRRGVRIAAVFATVGGLTVLTGCGPSGTSNGTTATASQSGQDMLAALRALLPEGNASEAAGQDPETLNPRAARPSPPPSTAGLTFDDGHGAAKITVALYRFAVPVSPALSQCRDTAYHPYSQCTSKTLSDGTLLVLDKSPASEAAPSGVQRWTALLTSQDGEQVVVDEVNARDDKDTTVSRPAPPLPLEQLTAIATSTTWKPFLAALPAPPTSAPTQQTRQATAEQITGILTTLLPAGLRTADQGGSDGFGHLTVDDGHGKSLVVVNVQQWKSDDPAALHIFKDADTLPGGTRIRIEQAPASRGGEGAIAWTVDTFHADGLRVLVSAVNAQAYVVPATRANPALTIPQLKQIALDNRWKNILLR
jgi:hypothetical protein